MAMRKQAEDINAYIADFPKDVQKKLKEVRSTMKKVIPKGEEAIKYAIPTFMLDGKNFIHFAAFKNHIGVYPPPHGDEALAKAMEVYRTGKGTLQFPLDSPLPLTFIKRVVKQRLKEWPSFVKPKKK